ncbi:hypothetical protein [Nannocystis punicea]|uniref:Uncharacterized protein n=1 Tax=Nannocystis punicea TaxID=2995304 RepID=A0ABY7GXH9_9BACT|nr:hypothetical protein [Nannocystis poenicansa]WAS91671.1 hypothetical protein O0S08_36275 [Nannocystis poenicansa]
MKKLVRICALFNASMILAFLVPGVLPLLGIAAPPSPFWLWLPSLLALFSVLVLWLSAEDLRRYGTFPYWSGLSRLAFFALTFALDFPATAGQIVALIALVDLVLGLACVLGLPRATGRTPLQLLLHRGVGR